MVRWILGFALASLMVPSIVRAEGLAPDAPLFRAIRQADAALFGAANACDIEAFAALVDDDFEFYHDRMGLAVGKAALVEATRNNLCHKVRRTLIDDSLEIYPLASYGAIEAGRHRFCNMVETPVCKKATSGTGRFFMLWRTRPGGYRLARVVSYDHVDR